MIKRKLKKLVDYLFGDYLDILKKINQNLTIIRLLIMAEQKPTIKKQADNLITALGPLKPLNNKSIFGA